MQQTKNQFASSQLKFSVKPPQNPYKISEINDAYKYFYAIWDKELIDIQEQVYALYLNQAHEVIAWRCLHTGTINKVPIDKRLLFGFALGCMAVGVIIAHNHPTGKINPSQSDFIQTKELRAASKLLDIEFLDHLIIGQNQFYSFSAKEKGLKHIFE